MTTVSSNRQVFLLSPANCSGKRAGFLLRKGARSALAERLRSGSATLGELFTFMSQLYFRGKLAYATAFASAPDGVRVIAPGLGLSSPHTVIDLKGLRAMSRIPVDPENHRYLAPLERDATRLADQLAPDDSAILLGSVATSKYLGPLKAILGSRLRFPREFIGRGDMSRGSLMLKCVADARELTYVEEA